MLYPTTQPTTTTKKSIYNAIYQGVTSISPHDYLPHASISPEITPETPLSHSHDIEYLQQSSQHLLPVPTLPSSRLTIADCQAYHRDHVHHLSPCFQPPPETVSPSSSFIFTVPPTALQRRRLSSDSGTTICHTLIWGDNLVLEDFLERHRLCYELTVRSQSRMARRQISNQLTTALISCVEENFMEFDCSFTFTMIRDRIESFYGVPIILYPSISNPLPSTPPSGISTSLKQYEKLTSID
ncbi:hypothetical protein TrCOL_g12360 [Triparma columacea]|uniref:Uncharacterized protein n=1 Tax=Triparma columacea TaxID=722753 RepID=A0A9W7GM64_9STRA|nr:hypothetical protein TrCOL_g12360 [Triparma columacea]